MSKPVAARSSTGAALRYQDFRLFQLTRFAVVVATQMMSVAVGWHVYDITRRPIDLGYVGLAQFLPAFLLALPAGSAADHFDRRRVVAVCQSVNAACALSLFFVAASGSKSVWLIYLL